MSLLSVEYGVLREVFELFDIKRINLLGSTRYFRSILVVSDIWKGAGWGTIIYLAAISNIDPIYEQPELTGQAGLTGMVHNHARDSQRNRASSYWLSAD